MEAVAVMLNPLTFTVPFLAFVAAAIFFRQLAVAVLALYFAGSVVAFIAYALDKSASRNDRRRTPEITLHILGLIGGWPGALVAQNILRHKSKKKSFQWVFWITVIVNCGALGWLLSSSGSHALKSILDVTCRIISC